MAKVVEFLGFDPLPKCDNLAERLVNYRKARSLDQKALAGELGVDPGTLARREREEGEPKGMLAQLVEATLRLSLPTHPNCFGLLVTSFFNLDI